jgi:hypothetical protein
MCTSCQNPCLCDAEVTLPYGNDGSDGTAGASVSSATINGSNELVLTLSDATTVNAGVIPSLAYVEEAFIGNSTYFTTILAASTPGDIYTTVIPSGTILNEGDTIKVRGFAKPSGSSDVIDFRFKLNSSTVATFQIPSGIEKIRYTIDIVRKSATLVFCVCKLEVIFNTMVVGTFIEEKFVTVSTLLSNDLNVVFSVPTSTTANLDMYESIAEVILIN